MIVLKIFSFLLLFLAYLADCNTELGTYQPLEAQQDCGFRLSSGYIVGGTEAKRGDFPFIASLGYKSSGTYFKIKSNHFSPYEILWFLWSCWKWNHLCLWRCSDQQKICFDSCPLPWCKAGEGSTKLVNKQTLVFKLDKIIPAYCWGCFGWTWRCIWPW